MNSITNNNFDLKGKKVLLRVDLNVPMKNGSITETSRIEKIIPTIKLLLKKEAKIIIMSHIGRPKGKVVNGMSLKPISEKLSLLLNKNVFFIEDIIIYTKIIGYNYHWSNKKYSELKEYRNKVIKNFEDKNWFDIYRYKMLLLKKISDETRILDDFVDMVDLKTDDLENKLNEQINKLKNANLKKNFYILTSIFSQITSLLFLLLLFRSFIRK